MNRVHDAPAVFSTGAGRALMERVCSALELPPASFEERSFEDGEHKTRPLESVRGRDVYLVESLYRDESASVNDKLVRSLFFIAGLRDAGARRVTLIAPYLCYARKDMRTKARDPVNTRYVAQLVEAVGMGVRQEHPGAVRFNHLDGRRTIGMRVGTPERGDDDVVARRMVRLAGHEHELVAWHGHARCIAPGEAVSVWTDFARARCGERSIRAPPKSPTRSARPSRR